MLRKLLIGRRNKYIEDVDGEVTYYTISKISFDGTNNVNTGFKPFNGKNFTMTLKAKFSYSDNSSMHYPTLINALEEISPYNGFLIRYEGSTLYLVHKNEHYTMSLDSDDYLNITATLQDGTLTIINNSTTVATISVTYTLEDLTVYLGCSVDDSGTSQRGAVAYIDYFEIKKI